MFWTLSLRRFARKLRINKFLSKFFYSSTYEKKFDNALMVRIKPGDVVWDVGANIGFYTKKISEIVGVNGIVYSFEPVPNTFSLLKKSIDLHDNVVTLDIALGSEDSTVFMKNGQDLGDPTNRIINDDDKSLDTIEVKLFSADTLIIEKQSMVPTAIKIDVEGYEVDVIRGMKSLLANKNLTTLAIELHFALLDERGEASGVQEIIESLELNNFSITWPDPSHIIAVR